MKEKIDFDELNSRLAATAAGVTVDPRALPPGEQLMSELEIFELARLFAQGSTQKEIAETLEKNTGKKVSVPAINKMLKGQRPMLSLAMEWVLACYPAIVEWEEEKGQPLRYFKLKEH